MIGHERDGDIRQEGLVFRAPQAVGIGGEQQHAAEGILFRRDDRHAHQVTGVGQPEQVAQSFDVGGGTARWQAQRTSALEGVGEHGDDVLVHAPALQVLFADQVVAAGDLHLVVVVGQIDQEAQVGQHGLGDGARDRLAQLCRCGFACQRQQGMEGLGVGAVAAAFPATGASCCLTDVTRFARSRGSAAAGSSGSG